MVEQKGLVIQALDKWGRKPAPFQTHPPHDVSSREQGKFPVIVGSSQTVGTTGMCGSKEGECPIVASMFGSSAANMVPTKGSASIEFKAKEPEAKEPEAKEPEGIMPECRKCDEIEKALLENPGSPESVRTSRRG